jgi:hypothetical protein
MRDTFNQTYPTTKTLGDLLNKPLGPMLQEAGYFSAEEVAQSGEVQAELLAIRNAHRVNPDGEQPDLVKLIADEHTRKALLAKLDSDGTYLAEARQIVDGQGGVNAKDETFAVPLIGQIHVALHGVPAAVKNAALAAQHFVRLMNTVERLRNGAGATPEADAVSNPRDMVSFNNDSMPDKIIQTIRRQINEIEKQLLPGEHHDALASRNAFLRTAIDGLPQLFSEAAVGQTGGKFAALMDLAEAIETVVRDFIAAHPGALPQAQNRVPTQCQPPEPRNP